MFIITYVYLSYVLMLDLNGVNKLYEKKKRLDKIKFNLYLLFINKMIIPMASISYIYNTF